MSDPFVLSRHASGELVRRGISREELDLVLSEPQQIVEGYGSLVVYQSRFETGGKTYLLRAVVNEFVTPAVVVTIYRTSKVFKYWRTE